MGLGVGACVGTELALGVALGPDDEVANDADVEQEPSNKLAVGREQVHKAPSHNKAQIEDGESYLP